MKWFWTTSIVSFSPLPHSGGIHWLFDDSRPHEWPMAVRSPSFGTDRELRSEACPL